MTQELVKKLADSGYVSAGNGGSFEEDGKIYQIPTLSELIQACGDKFILLEKLGEEWECVPSDKFGKNPEEAVANLWLELNKK